MDWARDWRWSCTAQRALWAYAAQLRPAWSTFWPANRACGQAIDQEAMAAAEVACWARLSSQAFVDQRLACCRSALEDVDAIIDMIEIARGATAQAELGRRLCALVKRHNFEVEVRSGPDPTRLRLGRLAVLIKRLGSSPLPASVCTEAQAALRRLACRIDADSRLAAGMLASRQLERTRTS